MSGRTGTVKARHLRLAVGLVVLVLTASCSDPDDADKTECEIACSDGFKTTHEGSCSINDAIALGLYGGHGNCTFKTRE